MTCSESFPAPQIFLCPNRAFSKPSWELLYQDTLSKRAPGGSNHVWQCVKNQLPWYVVECKCTPPPPRCSVTALLAAQVPPPELEQRHHGRQVPALHQSEAIKTWPRPIRNGFQRSRGWSKHMQSSRKETWGFELSSLVNMDTQRCVNISKT